MPLETRAFFSFEFRHQIRKLHRRLGLARHHVGKGWADAIDDPRQFFEPGLGFEEIVVGSIGASFIAEQLDKLALITEFVAETSRFRPFEALHIHRVGFAVIKGEIRVS